MGQGLAAYQTNEVEDGVLASTPDDPRAHHCNTLRELELFKFSSNYQSSAGGVDDLFSMHLDIEQEVFIQ